MLDSLTEDTCDLGGWCKGWWLWCWGWWYEDRWCWWDEVAGWLLPAGVDCIRWEIIWLCRATSGVVCEGRWVCCWFWPKNKTSSVTKRDGSRWGQTIQRVIYFWLQFSIALIVLICKSLPMILCTAYGELIYNLVLLTLIWFRSKLWNKPTRNLHINLPVAQWWHWKMDLSYQGVCCSVDYNDGLIVLLL